MGLADVKTEIKKNLDLKEPPMFKVIYINDNQTTLEFVIQSLIEHFRYTYETAEKITVDIHTQGAATGARCSGDIGHQHLGIGLNAFGAQDQRRLRIRQRRQRGTHMLGRGHDEQIFTCDHAGEVSCRLNLWRQ